MKKLLWIAAGTAAMALASCHNTPKTDNSMSADTPSTTQETAQTQAPASVPADETVTEGLVAHIYTKKGRIDLVLEPDKAPLTVANFIGLAEGKIACQNRPNGAHFYDGLKFHRVIADFMIQGGDPMGNGSGGPGYKFSDEFDPTLQFNRPGILAMANSGPATNGSQFFITHKETPWLNGKHSIFGHVIKGQAVVNAIQQDDVMDSIRIERLGEKAKKFDAPKIFDEKMVAVRKAEAERMKAEKLKMMEIPEFNAWVKKTYPQAKRLADGMYIVVTKQGNGPKPSKGQLLTVHYTGTFADGTKFDSSLDGGQPFQFPLGAGRVIQGWDDGFAALNVGSQAKLLIPYTLGYGEQGQPGAIPPKATLIFDVQFLNAQ
jgi:peptidylprolyl isomerase